MPVVLTRLKERRKESVVLAHTPRFWPLHAAEGRHFDSEEPERHYVRNDDSKLWSVKISKK